MVRDGHEVHEVNFGLRPFQPSEVVLENGPEK